MITLTNTIALKNEIIKKGYNQKSLAKELGISQARLKRKINAVQDFKASEMITLGSVLELTDEQKSRIFFTMDPVSKGEK